MSDPEWAQDFTSRFPTVDDYLRHHQQAGHICCYCPQQDPPLPCCNAGHGEAERLRREFETITAALRGDTP